MQNQGHRPGTMQTGQQDSSRGGVRRPPHHIGGASHLQDF